MAKQYSSKKLLVEGEEDKRVIPQLIEANGVPWGDTSDAPVVEIKPCDGFEGMVRPSLIKTELMESGLEALGIVADANGDAQSRWNSLRARCTPSFPDLPESLPSDGLTQENDAGLKLGVWLMPDNQSHGMMETFLTYLVPNEGNPILEHAERARDKARALGAPFKDAHADKAKIHTWLAWQNPPGRPLHNAVMERILDPCSCHAAAFVRWFRSLFDL